jgi:hypothetical protein
MTRALKDTDPLGKPPAGATTGADAPAPAAESAEPEPQMPLRAPTEDEPMRSLLDGLNASEGPAPVNSPTTHGDLAARYAAGPGAPPARHQTPAPEPSVVFSQTMRLATMPAPVEAAIRERAASPETSRLATTVRIDRRETERALAEAGVPMEGRDDVREEAFRSGERRGLLLGLPIGFAAGGVAAFLVAFFLMFARGAHTRAAPTNAPAAPSASAPATPVASVSAVPAGETSPTPPAPAEAPAPAGSVPAADSVSGSAPAPAASAAEPRPPAARPAAGKRPRGAPANSSAPAGQPATKPRTDKNMMVNEL